jgi:hypothetical protein
LAVSRHDQPHRVNMLNQVMSGETPDQAPEGASRVSVSPYCRLIDSRQAIPSLLGSVAMIEISIKYFIASSNVENSAGLARGLYGGWIRDTRGRHRRALLRRFVPLAEPPLSPRPVLTPWAVENAGTSAADVRPASASRESDNSRAACRLARLILFGPSITATRQPHETL